MHKSLTKFDVFDCPQLYDERKRHAIVSYKRNMRCMSFGNRTETTQQEVDKGKLEILFANVSMLLWSSSDLIL